MHEGYNLLFGAIALQKGLIAPKRLAECMAQCANRQGMLLADLLCEQGVLNEKTRRSVDEHISSAAGLVVQTVAQAHPTDPAMQIVWTAMQAPWVQLRASNGQNSPSSHKSAGSPTKTSEAVLVGQNRYHLGPVYAEGGLGRIRKAHDFQFHREVAVKELLPQFADNPEAKRRFTKEAQITGQLEHPYIVPVYTLHTSGQVAYAMRFVRGKTLKEAMHEYHERRKSGKAAPAEMRHLLAALVRTSAAIAFAHSRGVVHRDIKPANIVLGEFDEMFLLDWGLAKVIDDSTATHLSRVELTHDVQDEDRTVAGRILGSPAYMAPEQAGGMNDQIDGRTDIYGLGAILFEIISGESPHQRFREDGPAKFFDHIVEGNLPSAREINPEAPCALDAVCRKALANDPKDRYSTASEFADEVQRWLDGEPVTVRVEPPMRRLVRWAVRNQRIAQIIAALLLATIVGGATFILDMRQSADRLVRNHWESLESQTARIDVAIRAKFDTFMDDVRIVAHTPSLQTYAERSRTEQPPTAEMLERVRLTFIDFLKYKRLYLSASISIKDGDSFRETIRAFRGRVGAPVRIIEDAQIPDENDLKLGEIERAGVSSRTLLSHVWMAGFHEADVDSHAMVARGIVPIAIDGKTIAAVVLTLDIHELFEQLLEPSAQAGLLAYVVNENGELLMGTSPEGKLEYYNGTQRKFADVLPHFAEFLSERSNADQEGITSGVDGSIAYGARIHYDPNAPQRYLTVVIGSDIDRLLDIPTSIRSAVEYAVTGLVLVAAISVFFFLRELSRVLRGID